MSLIALVNAAELLIGSAADVLPDSAAALAVADDQALAAALAQRGIRSQRVAWSDPSVDWAAFEGVVLRAAWDYLDDLPAFEAWLAHPALATRLINTAPLLQWNLDKRYLLTLAQQGLPVVPTCYRPAGPGFNLAAFCQDAGWNEVVVKPAVSASGMDTYRLKADDHSLDAELGALSAERALLVQPFLPGVLARGEVSIMVMVGEPTHAVRKRARDGEFRVQSNHGGSVEAYQPTEAEWHFARQVVAGSPQRPAYARVDFVQSEDGPLLMELELLEPDLFLRLSPAGTSAFAAAIAATVSGSISVGEIGADHGAVASVS